MRGEAAATVAVTTRNLPLIFSSGTDRCGIDGMYEIVQQCVEFTRVIKSKRPEVSHAK